MKNKSIRKSGSENAAHFDQMTQFWQVIKEDKPEEKKSENTVHFNKVAMFWQSIEEDQPQKNSVKS